MPRYFFNVHDGRSSPDRDGTDLSGPFEARVMAIKLTGAILCDDAEKMEPRDALRIEVMDETGATVFETNVDLDTPVADGSLKH